jgi:hypothetical protein
MTEALMQEAIPSMDSVRNNKKPFLLYMAHYTVQHFADRSIMFRKLHKHFKNISALHIQITIRQIQKLKQ